jgi:DNA-binding transcriptional LysR family regulator
MLSLPRLTVLHAAARTGSLTLAAEALSYTPSAVSQQIALLERETGAQLLERHARGVRLTEAGRVLVEHTATVLAELEAAEDALDAVVHGEGGRLRFASFPTANAVLMPRAVAAFRPRHPGVELVLSERDRDDGLAGVAGRELDLALVYEFSLVPVIVPATVEVRPLLVDAVYIMLPERHRLARRRRLRLGELADEPWIQGVRSGSTLDVLPMAARAAGFEAQVVFRTDDQTTVRGLVAAGLGIAMVPSLIVASLPPGVVVLPLDEPALTRTVMVALPSARPLPAAMAMVAALEAAAKDAPLPALAPERPAALAEHGIGDAGADE